jgi:hypothetical protein
VRLSELAVPAQWAQRGLGLALTVITLMAARDLPRWGDALFVAASLYLLALIKCPRLWLVLLPLFCVTVDLAPWTGRFLYNELDVIVWLTIAAALICARYRLPNLNHLTGQQTLGFAIMLAFVTLALLGSSGLSAVYDPPGASYNSPYLSEFYSYKVLKGLLWAALLVPLWRELCDVDPAITLRLFSLGAALAAFGLFVVILWERGTLAAIAEGPVAVWASFSDLATYYRTIGLFSNMRTGGEALDGTIILLLAVCTYGGLYAQPRWLVWACRLAILTLAYVTLVGFTRATYAAFALTLSLVLALELYRLRGYLRLRLWDAILLATLLPLCFSSIYLVAINGDRVALVAVCVADELLLIQIARVRLHWPTRRAWLPATAMVGISLVFALGLTAETMGGRMQSVDRDLDTRWTHWGDVVRLAREARGNRLLGQGAGTFPALYQQYLPQKRARIGGVAVNPDAGLLRLEGAGDLLFAQRLSLKGDELRLEFAARAIDGGRLSVALCARNVLDTGWSGGRCDTQLIEVLPGPSFQTHALTLALPLEARSGPATQWPKAIQFRNLDEKTPVEISVVRALSGLDTPIRNASFNNGMDNWFLSTDFGHLPFHIKNIWLQFWFDHGWVGLILVAAMFFLLTLRALRAPVGQEFTPMAAVAVLGLGAVGMFGTPLDEARVSWLFFVLLFSGLLEPQRRAAPLALRVPR